VGRDQRRVGVSKAEARLVAALRTALANESALSHRPRIYALELDSFRGVADLVVGESNGHLLLPSGTPRRQLTAFSLSTARVLAALGRKKATRISEIAKCSGLSDSTVRGQLRKLKDAGIVQSEAEGQIQVLHRVSPPFYELVAFEVKVKDWKSGLRQARNYRSFANRTYLALPLDRAEAVKKHREMFKRFKVGLVGIGKTGTVQWFVKPRRSTPISPAHNFYASILLLKQAPIAMFKPSEPPWPSPARRPNSAGETGRSAARM
jgi:DNA-binding transcriptional ArsR family regulator